MAAIVMDEPVAEKTLFAAFNKYDEFRELQTSLLAASDLSQDPTSKEKDQEYDRLRALSNILNEYQEQSYLLDPYLEGLVVPVIQVLKDHARDVVSDPSKPISSIRVERICLLIYAYIKCRGYKTIIRFFPHEVADLSVALGYLRVSHISQDSQHWALRYIVLLWLSLICMIPFDLSQFDEVDHEGETASKLEHLARDYVGKAGLERDAAAILLSRLFSRKDMQSKLPQFVESLMPAFSQPSEIFLCIGILQFLCEVIAAGTAEQTSALSSHILEIVQKIDTETFLSANTIARKYRSKLLARFALRLLPDTRLRRKGVADQSSSPDGGNEDEIEIPEVVETILEALFRGLQDKDTVVRWSAAKGVARISERLPTDFVEQVLDTVLGNFAIHSTTAASLYDMPAIAEGTWHGACLASAEMARRNLVSPDKVPQLVNWLLKALYFDLRKGAHSIGSSVRDSASYVLWAMARTQDTQALLPHSLALGQHLVTVAVFDREIHIRRAASAAFQEYVGRTSLPPHGIAILRETDFYAVSVRRNAFLVAAPQVARYAEYREALFDHLLNITVRHWDVSMRQIGSQAIRQICLIDMDSLAPRAIEKVGRLLEAVDSSDIHGGLLVLSELSLAYRSCLEGAALELKLHEIFKELARVPHTTLTSSRNELITAAACTLISNTITLTEMELNEQTSVPQWRIVVDFGIKHRGAACQEEAASALGSMSRLADCSQTTLIRELKVASPIIQQSLGQCLGSLAYDAHPNSLESAINCILECVPLSTSPMKTNIEARRNFFESIARIYRTVSPNIARYISAQTATKLWTAMLDGLNDYSSDERGDVGSWIRIACVRGLTEVATVLFQNSATLPAFESYLDPERYHSAIAGILKQGVERLDNVRQDSGACFLRLLRLPLPEVENQDRWRISGETLFKEIFPSEGDDESWGYGNVFFPKAVQFLKIERYRASVIQGLVLSIGSKTDSIHRPLSTSLVTYCNTIPLESSDHTCFSLLEFAGNLLAYAKSKPASNGVVIPVLQTFNILFEGDVLGRLADQSQGIETMQSLLRLCLNNINRIKNVQRVFQAMKIVVHLLALEPLLSQAVSGLSSFLAHHFPSVRNETAEYLFIFLQSHDLGCDTGEVEKVLLETEWLSDDVKIASEAAQHVISAFQRARTLP